MKKLSKLEIKIKKINKEADKKAKRMIIFDTVKSANKAIKILRESGFFS